MAQSTQHYETLLARHYTWMAGGLPAQSERNRQFFRTHNIVPLPNGIAVDLGCGSGFQSIPLAELGFQLISIDTSETLLQELRENSVGLNVTVVQDDLMNFDKHCPGAVDLIVCMGDTLPHLDSLQDVQRLFETVRTQLTPGGKIIVTFRDLTTERTGTSRFIPVRSDKRTIFTCFLEYADTHISVHDLVYEKIDAQWVFHASTYQKLRIAPDWTRATLESTGLTIHHATVENGMVTIIAGK